MPVEVRTVQQAYRFALDPTPAQERMLRSHAGAARFAYNWGIARTIGALDARKAEEAAGGDVVTEIPKHFALCKDWTAWKDAHLSDPEPEPGERRTNTAWVAENFVGTYQAALRDAAKAWDDFFKSRRGERKGRKLGRPRFKKRGKARDSFQVHGDTLRVESTGSGFRPKGADKGATRDMVVLPKIGPVFLAEPARKLRRWLRKPGVACPECCGWGSPGTVPAAADSKARSAVACPACGGSGGRCGTCDGSGRVRGCPACGGKQAVAACRIVRGTIARESDGRWFIALTVEAVREVHAARVREKRGKTVREWASAPSPCQRKGGKVGADFGVRELATLSDGTVIPNPRHLEACLARLARAQRALSRCDPGSGARRRAAERVGRLHARVRHLRLDSLHKATSALVHGYEEIVVEGFDVQETARYRRAGKVDPKKSRSVPGKVRENRNRALADTGIGIARWQLESKAAWYGCQVVKTDKHAPTGRTCSACGTVKAKPVPPADEWFACEACGVKLPRRLNTARVLLSVTAAPSTGEAQNAPGGAVSPGAARGTGLAPVKGEASTRPRPG